MSLKFFSMLKRFNKLKQQYNNKGTETIVLLFIFFHIKNITLNITHPLNVFQITYFDVV